MTVSKVLIFTASFALSLLGSAPSSLKSAPAPQFDIATVATATPKAPNCGQNEPCVCCVVIQGRTYCSDECSTA
jgi:hypothetical protein